FFFSSRRRHTRSKRDWSSDVCSSDLNALSVIAICHYEGIPVEDIKKLKTFQGVKRRFTDKQVGNQIIADDYAHHPIEVKVTIERSEERRVGKECRARWEAQREGEEEK